MMAHVLAYGPVRNRLDSNNQIAAEERWRLNYVNLEMMKAHPIIGIGLNTAYDSKQAYLPSFFTEDDWIYIAHNQYLLIGAEAGIVGLIAFLRILWIAIKSSAAAARAPDSIVSETGAVLLAYMIALVWGMNLDFYGGMQVYVLLWFFFGCAAGVSVLARREADEAAAAAAPPVCRGRS
jgi:O-antigen ligase